MSKEIFLEKVDEMCAAISSWLAGCDYNYIECNYVPECFISKHHSINMLWRTFFRLCPFNVRRAAYKGRFPDTPQALVALLKAYVLMGDKEVVRELYSRALSLRSPLARNFALKQGIRISVNLYENSAETPTPLNTVWFGEFLLEENLGVVGEEEKRERLLSIARYLVEELGYADHGSDGVYFYYGPTLKKEIYNASALISAFLIRLGVKYGDENYKKLGYRGIQYICKKQNDEGSWFYAGYPERPTIDCFHQAYILQALCAVQSELPFDVEETIAMGVEFYQSLFVKDGKYLRPVRYDKRFTPRNTWLMVKVDGRDVVEGLIFFSIYKKDPDKVRELVEYAYDRFYDKRHRCMYPEIFVYGKNRNQYIEFQAWFLYAFAVVSSCIKKEGL